MPQIWPMNWLALFLFFLSCFILFAIILYFNISAQPKKGQIEFKKTPSLQWEW